MASAIAESSNLPKPLPQVPGPKLAPFTPTAHAPVEFIRPLGHTDSQDGYVWKVNIDGKAFALKMFVFNTVQALATGPGKYIEDPLVTDQAYIDYFDPFNCECRAYGRLLQERREDLAVRAHGYLLLTPAQERVVTAEIDGDFLDAPDPSIGFPLKGRGIWGRYEEHRDQPVRAIVKDLIEDCEPFEENQAPQLWHDLEALHSLGILVRDIHAGNYMGGKLVDFSLAWTMYHPALDRISEYDIHGFQRDELNNLEQMMYDVWNWHQSWEIDIPADLTSLTVGERMDETGTDPRCYDWRKWEENAAEADRHIAEDVFWPYEDELPVSNEKAE